jgi:hypothetical protein
MASDKNIAIRNGPQSARFPVKIKVSEIIRNSIANPMAILKELIFFMKSQA